MAGLFIFSIFMMFMIPAVIAWNRNSSSRTALTICSMINGIIAVTMLSAIIFCIFIGFILTVWACIDRKHEEKLGTVNADKTHNLSKKKEQAVDQLVKLAQMKEKGLLSEQEYEAAKQKVFNDTIN